MRPTSRPTIAGPDGSAHAGDPGSTGPVPVEMELLLAGVDRCTAEAVRLVERLHGLTEDVGRLEARMRGLAPEARPVSRVAPIVDIAGRFSDETGPMITEIRSAAERHDTMEVGRVAQLIERRAGSVGGRRLVVSCDYLRKNAAAGRLSDNHSDIRRVETDYDELTAALTREQAEQEAVGRRRTDRPLP